MRVVLFYFCVPFNLFCFVFSFFFFSISFEYSATGYAIEPRLKQIQDEDAGHIFREATSASSISDSVNRINKNQYNYRDEVNLDCFCNFHYYRVNEMSIK